VSISRKKGPLYLQVKNILKDRILYGEYRVGTNIPSEPLLEGEFNVSKITVRNAIKELVQEGFLEARSGIGTKVIRNTVASKLYKGKRFTEVLVEEGRKIKKQSLHAEIVDNDEGTEPFRLFGEKSLRIQRLYYLDDVPYIYYTHYLPMRMAGTEPLELDFHSLYDFIEEQGISLEKFRDEFVVSLAPSHIEDKLHVKKGTHLLKRSRYSYDEKEEAVEFSEGYYKTQMQQYVVNYDM
jgi:DNA-binding GntR family transcriptional regulator